MNQSTNQLKAYALIESVLAMVIISIAFVIGMMVVQWVLDSSRPAKQWRVELDLLQTAQNTRQTAHFKDETVLRGDYRIEKTIELYGDKTDLHQLNLTALDDKDRVLGVWRELIFLPE